MEQQLLAEFYRRYQRELYLYLFSLCRDSALAEDLMQETFLKAMLSLPEGHANVRAWLYKVARNLCWNRLRREARTTPREDLPLTAGDGSPLDQALTNETQRVLYQGLSRLELRKREVLQMQYFGGLSQKEIAAVLHLTPEHVRVLAHRARRELKQWMEENGYDLP